MTTLGLQISVLVVLGVEFGTQVIIVLDEEVGFADTYPKEFRVLAEQLVNLRVAVGIDTLDTTLLLLVDSGGEEADIIEGIGVIDADEQAVEATHRQAGDGTVGLVGLHPIGFLDEADDIGECGLEMSVHRLWQHHRGHDESL